MTPTRGAALFAQADEQISELIALLSSRGDAALTLPCPGRAKLGDGTVGATALHTAGNYSRIAEFVQDRVRGGDGSEAGAHGGHDHRLRARAARVAELCHRLTAALEGLRPIASLSDEQLDAVPPDGAMRFCDGQRSVEQVLASLLNHQRHAIDALKVAPDAITGMP